MHKLLWLSLFLLVSVRSFAQTAANSGPERPKEPREVLAAAAPFYDFSSSEMPPWHMKASYQLYDLKGKPTERGTWEYWWISPKVYRSSWTRAGSEHTEWSTAKGLYSKDQGTPLGYFERTIQESLVSPLTAASALKTDKVQLELKMFPPEKPKVECVVSGPPASASGGVQGQVLNIPTYSCFDPPTLALRMTRFDELTKEFSQIVRFHDRYLARQVEATTGRQRVFSASIETIENLDPKEASLIPPADAVVQPQAPGMSGGSKVTPGALIKKTQPVYPMLSKTAHEQGLVLLAARIGKDGRVHDLEVLASPSSLLAESALACVKNWQYTPYLLDGQPVEVETTLKVIYSLGR